MLLLPAKIRGRLFLQAEAAYPEECCGIILGLRQSGQRLAYKIAPVRNAVSKERVQTDFLIDPLAFMQLELAAAREGLEVIGFYHSHPDHEAFASAKDRLYMLEEHSYLIIAVQKGAAVRVNSFAKMGQTKTVVKEEILMKEKCDADFGICIGNPAGLCQPKAEA